MWSRILLIAAMQETVLGEKVDAGDIKTKKFQIEFQLLYLRTDCYHGDGDDAWDLCK